MRRAAILIGVDRTGGLPVLNDAAAGARRMHAWAAGQGVDSTLITDAQEPVEVRTIRAAVAAVVARGVYEQLLVYFAGHGVNIRYGEYWLLSGAPDNTQEAVNVEASVTLARYCGVPHVVIISDCCRSAAASVRSQFVNGSEIFPNSGSIFLEQPVDKFYACALGRPAYEVGDANTYTALYTDALLEGLRGELADAVDWTVDQDEEATAYVRPRRLKRALALQVTRRIVERKLQAEIVQMPDAQICSDDAAWLAHLQSVPTPTYRSGARHARRPTAAERAAAQFRQVLDMSDTDGAQSDAGARPERARTASACSFRIDGGAFLEVDPGRTGGVVRRQDNEATLSHQASDGAPVLLSTSCGPCVVLPALRGFVVTLTMEDGQLADVAYDRVPASRIGAVRAEAAGQSREGRFQLDRDDARALARRMLRRDGMDPALALYAAYACDAAQQRRLVRLLCAAMDRRLGASWFDLAMLARAPHGRQPATGGRLLSLFPMLSPGWGRLSALDTPLADALRDLQPFLTASLWTSFDQGAVPMLRHLIDKGELR